VLGRTRRRERAAHAVGAKERQRTAAQLAGYTRRARHHPSTHNEEAARERAHALTWAALVETTFVLLETEGRALRDEQVAAPAFANEDPT
jgi:hypothetical protein